MSRFRVAATNPVDKTIALRDAAGEYHLAYARAELPGIDLELRGVSPVRGCRALLSAPSGKVFRVTFQRVNCGQGAALKLLQASQGQG